MTRINAILDAQQAERLRAVAAANGMSVSALVRVAVERLLRDGRIFVPSLHANGVEMEYRGGGE